MEGTSKITEQIMGRIWIQENLASIHEKQRKTLGGEQLETASSPDGTRKVERSSRAGEEVIEQGVWQ